MPEHSFRCGCGKLARIYFTQEQYPYPDALPCPCGGQMNRFFERAPGMAPDVWNPYYDVGLGEWIHSRKHRTEVMHAKGFDEVMGPDEFERNRKAHSPKDEFSFSEADKATFRDCADKAMNDLKYGNVAPPEPEQLSAVDTATPLVVES